MKLAEALSIRKDIREKLAVLEERIENNVVSKEGEEPAEDAEMLLKEAFLLCEKERDLISQINLTNSKTMFNEKETMTEALARRDSLLAKRNLLVRAVDGATSGRDRYSQTELKDIRHIDVKKIQKEIDSLSQEYRKLDLKIQEINWSTEIL